MLLRRLLAPCLSAALMAQAPAQIEGPGEAKRQHQALVAAGYNLTYGLHVGKESLQLDLLVLASEEEHQLSLWVAAPEGDASARLLDRDGKPVFAWSGSRGELKLSRRLAPGRYRLELEAAVQAAAEFGVKGPLLASCALDAARTQERAAQPAQGFRWPYLLYTPSRLKRPCLLVAPLNTGFATEDPELLRAAGACDVARQTELAEALGCRLLVPLFPRPGDGESNLYLHALTRAALQAMKPEWARVDLQLLRMIEDVQARLGLGRDKVLITGFSASGSFADRFALLHPERVLAAACGSPGGWPTAPRAEVDGETLNYPLGLADAAQLAGQAPDPKAQRAVAFFVYMGDQDTNDAAPYRDSFSEADQALLFRRFGTTPLARWKASEALYKAAGLKARFVLYPGAAHSVTEAMAADVQAFFEAELEKAYR